jgi:uncharacterized repeat protein (TIGR04052 family)
MTFHPRRIKFQRTVAALAVWVFGSACGDDDAGGPVSTRDAGAKSSDTESSPSNDAGGGIDQCAVVVTACDGKDDVDGVGNLCLRAAASGDQAACGTLVDSCLTYCETGKAPSRPAGAPSKEQCAAMGHACHDYDTGSGLGQLCHSVGHQANLSQCEALYDGCVELCNIEESDAGRHAHHPEEDAGVTADAGSLVPITLRFAAAVGIYPFECGAVYTGVGSSSSTVTPTDLRLFVSDVQLIEADGTRVPLEIDEFEPFQSNSVALLDFADGTGACSNADSALNAQITGVAPEGTYVGLSFSTSVPLDINHTDPTLNAPPLHPSNMTWSWLLGYKFLTAGLKQVDSTSVVDLDAGADAAVPAPVPATGAAELHVGSIGCYNPPMSDPATVECGKPNRNSITLSGFDPFENTVVLDVAQLFAKVDLSQVVMCHSATDGCADMFPSIGLDYATGRATAEQTAFRVE